MKKAMSFSVTLLVFVFSIYNMVQAAEENQKNQVISISEIEQSTMDVSITSAMNFEEMIQFYMQSTGASKEQALKRFGEQSDEKNQRERTYRVLSLPLEVSKDYNPNLDFYCETSESGGYWGILSAYCAQLVERNQKMPKQFEGNIEIWLRSPYQIEYAINGDFYNKETKISSNSHFKYYYDHKNVMFQR